MQKERCNNVVEEYSIDRPTNRLTNRTIVRFSLWAKGMLNPKEESVDDQNNDEYNGKVEEDEEENDSFLHDK